MYLLRSFIKHINILYKNANEGEILIIKDDISNNFDTPKKTTLKIKKTITDKKINQNTQLSNFSDDEILNILNNINEENKGNNKNRNLKIEENNTSQVSINHPQKNVRNTSENCQENQNANIIDHQEKNSSQADGDNKNTINSFETKENSYQDVREQQNNQNDLSFISNLPDELKHIELSDLNMRSIKELRDLANLYQVDLNNSIQKQHIIHAILRKVIFIPQITLTFDGILEVLEDNGGFGFLRSPKTNYNPSNNDVYVPNHIIKKYNLETGHSIYCTIKQQSNNKKGDKYYPLDRILKINGKDATNPETLDNIKERRHFDELTPCYPDERYKLENNKVTEQNNLINRMIDLMSPIGKGQRALIVAPPRTGKTVLLKNVANSISFQYPKAKLFILLIDERPEEVTDMRESINGEVISSTFDESAENHIHVAEMVLEKAKRLVECGEDVVIILDSITRLARAYNTMAPSSGKVLTGGIDSAALQRPKRWFGAARNIKNGGSLTIIASALVETGSRMDEVIFEEFKGTGNCEIVLDRRIAEKRIFPAIDILKSGTRKEELLMPQKELQRIWLLRRVLSSLSNNEATELLKDKILATKTNEDFLNNLGNNN